MAIQERLMELRFHIAFAAIFAGAVFSLIHVGPSFATVVNFFGPLLLSTGFFLAAVAVLLRISPPPPPETAGDQAGEELMDFVAGRPQAEVSEVGGSGEAEGHVEEKDQRGEEEAEEEHRKSQ